jgi:hypothetical protein
MRPSLTAPAVLLLLLPMLLGSGSRMQQRHSPQPVDTSNERYVRDLVGQDNSDRLYAARTLRSRLKVAMRDVERRDGTLRQLDAVATLDDIDELVAPACVEAIEYRNVAHHCAWILGRTNNAEAAKALEALAAPDSDTTRRARKQAARSLALWDEALRDGVEATE